MRRITPKQEAFAQLIVDGNPPSKAFRIAYDSKASVKVVSIMAQRVLKHHLVIRRCQELQSKAEAARTLGRIRKREMLARMLVRPLGQSGSLSREQLKAIEIDNVMAGHNEPEKIEVSGVGELVDMIRREAPKP